MNGMVVLASVGIGLTYPTWNIVSPLHSVSISRQFESQVTQATRDRYFMLAKWSAFKLKKVEVSNVQLQHSARCLSIMYTMSFDPPASLMYGVTLWRKPDGAYEGDMMLTGLKEPVTLSIR